MSDREFGIKITADGKVSVTALREVRDGLDQVSAAGKRAAEANSIGTQAQNAARDAAEKYIQTLRAEAETYSMTAMQRRAYHAAQLNMTQAQQDSAAAAILQIDAHEQQAAAIQKLTGYSIAAGAAVLAYAGALALSVKHSIDQAAAAAVLGEKLGMTAQRIAAIKYMAEKSDTSIDSLARAMAQLPRSIIEGGNTGSEAGRAFRFLGIDPAQLKTQEQAISAVADAIRRVEDPMAKSAVLQMISKRNGEELIPLFNKGADGIRRLTDEGERLNEISGETAEQSRALKDNMTTLQYASGALARSLAADLVPALNRVIEQYLEAKKEGDGFFSSTIQGLRNAGVNENKKFTDDVERLVGTMDRLDRINYQIQQVKNGPLAGTYALPALEKQKALIEGQVKALQEGVRMQQQLRTLELGTGPATPSGPTIPGMPDSRGTGGAERISEYERLTQSIREKIAVSQLDLQSEEKLTEAEKVAMKVMVDLRDGKLKATDAQKVYLAALLEEWIALDRNIAAGERDMKAREETQKVIEKLNKSARDSVDAINKEAASIEEQVRTYGMAKDAVIELSIARLEERKLFYSQFEDGGGMMAAIDREIEARRKLAGAIRSNDAAEAARKAADDEIKEQRRAAQEIEHLLGDSMMRAFERDGMKGAKVLRDSMERLFATLVLRPLIQPVAQYGANALLNSLGLPGATGAVSNGAGLLGNLGFGANAGYGAYGAFATSGMGAALGLSTAAVPGLMGPTMSGAALGGASLTALGTAMPYIGAGLMLANALGVFKDEDTPRNPWAGITTSGAGGPAGTLAITQTDLTGANADNPAFWQEINNWLAKLPDALKQSVDNMSLVFAPGTSAEQAWAQLQAQVISAAGSAGLTADEMKKLQPLAVQAAQATALATQKREMEITLMEATGDAAGALAARRAIEREGLDESLRPLQDQIWAAQDLTAETQKETEATNRLKESYQSTLASIEQLLPQEQQVSLAQARLTAGFASMGLELPTTAQGMYNLVVSLGALNPNVATINGLLGDFSTVISATATATAAAVESIATANTTLGAGGTGGTGLSGAQAEALDAYRLASLQEQVALANWKKGTDTYEAYLEAQGRTAAAFEAYGIALNGVSTATKDTAGEAKDLNQQLLNLQSPLLANIADLREQRAAIAAVNREIWDQVQAEKARASQRSLIESLMSEEQKLAAAQAQLTDGFARLNGVLDGSGARTIPRTREEITALISSLDLSTPRGQALLLAAQQLVPLWLQVEAAATQAQEKAATTILDTMKRITELMDSVRALGESIRASGHGIMQSSKGWDEVAYQKNQVALAQAALIAAGTPQERLAAAGELQSAIMGRYGAEMAALQKLRDAENKAGQEAVDLRNKEGQAAVDAFNKMNAIYQGLKDYAEALITGDMAPLGMKQKAGVTGAAYDELLAKTIGGDVEAGGKLQGAASALLRDKMASSRTSVEYAREFARIYGDINALGAKAGADKVFTPEVYAENTAKWEAALLDIQTRAINELTQLADLTDTWQAELQVALSEQALVFSQLGLSSQWIAENTKDLDKRIAIELAAVLNAKVAADAALQDVSRGSSAPYKSYDAARGFAAGTDYVPYDMVAQVHRGERITPAAYNRSDATTKELCEEVRALRAEVAKLRASSEATASHTGAQERFFRRISPDGESINVTATLA